MNCDCFFCKNERFSLNRMLNLEAEDSIIYEDKNVFVTLDIAPVVKGHYLIVTYEHINSYGNANENVYSSLEAAKEYLISNVYHTDNVIFWEHGAVISHSAGASIDHAHMHAIPMPLNIEIDSYLDSLEFINSTRQNLDYISLKKIALSGQPYISYEYGKTNKYFRCINWLPSQFFRIMISKYQPQEYDWKLRCKDRQSQDLFKESLYMAKLPSNFNNK